MEIMSVGVLELHRRCIEGFYFQIDVYADVLRVR